MLCLSTSLLRHGPNFSAHRTVVSDRNSSVSVVRGVVMREPVLYLFAKIGAFTALGAFIYFMMSKTEKKKLRGWLETGWLKFVDIPWRQLGRTEAASAIAVWDMIV